MLQRFNQIKLGNFPPTTTDPPPKLGNTKNVFVPIKCFQVEPAKNPLPSLRKYSSVEQV